MSWFRESVFLAAGLCAGLVVSFWRHSSSTSPNGESVLPKAWGDSLHQMIQNVINETLQRHVSELRSLRGPELQRGPLESAGTNQIAFYNGPAYGNDPEEFLRRNGVDVQQADITTIRRNPMLRQACVAALQPELVCWVDGVFDLTHYGHMYMFLKAREMGTRLVVGVNSDESVQTCKGTTPLVAERNRILVVENIRFVDRVETNVPYIMSADYLDSMIKKHDLSAIIHGNDPCLDLNGNDVYGRARELGLYRTIPRVAGISTTALIGRMISYIREDDPGGSTGSPTLHSHDLLSQLEAPKWKFTATSQVYLDFLRAMPLKMPGQIAVYLDGAFDMLHAGHVRTLLAVREAAEDLFGETPYLMVGVHSDRDVSKHWPGRPILNMHERVLSLMALRPVDCVIMDADWVVTPEYCAQHGIKKVFNCTNDNVKDFAKDRFGSLPSDLVYRLERPTDDATSVERLCMKISEKHQQFTQQIRK